MASIIIIPAVLTTTNLSLKSPSPFLDLRRSNSQRRPSSAVAALQHSHHDVVVVGAGIVGLAIAREFLLKSNLSVALVDARVPCSGGAATGAGQGYIWMGHRMPRSETWELSRRSKQLWEELARGLEMEGSDPLQVIGWKRTGSLLIGRTDEELSMLEKRVMLLNEAGIEAEYLVGSALQSEEPEIDASNKGAAFCPDDCQLDAKLTVSFIEKCNRYYASEGRYSEFYNNPVIRLLSTRGEIEAVETPDNMLYGRRAIIISTGAWSSSVMRSLIKSDDVPDIPVKPRKGYLLVLENKMKSPLIHGLMEIGYTMHSTAGASSLVTRLVKDDESLPGISMAATTDKDGNLVLGSSREFVGFNTEIDEGIIEKIWDRVGEYLPTLQKWTLSSLEKNIRSGFRPWMPDGKPIIGPVQGLPKLLLATGHEGSGLCMALGTAELVVDMAMGNRPKIDHIPFSIARLS